MDRLQQSGMTVERRETNIESLVVDHGAKTPLEN